MEIETRLVINRSGFWEVRWTEPDATGRGRTRGFSTKTTDKRDAEEQRRDFIRDVQEKKARAAARAASGSMSAMLDAYEASAVARHVGATQGYCLQHLRTHFGAFAPSELTPAAILAYRKARGVADTTLRRELSTLRAALGWAKEHEMIPSRPKIDLPPEGPRKEGFLIEGDERAFYAAAARDVGRDGRLSRVGRFICIGLDTGARKSAISGLTWDRVDLKRLTVDFRDPKLRETKKKRVLTPINTRLAPVLQRAFAERDPASPFVLDYDGDFDKTWAGFLARNGFADVTPHVLRHTRITLLLRQGVAMWDVARLVGASTHVIEKTYGHHVADERLRALADRRAS